jgi:hypothetical protein
MIVKIEKSNVKNKRYKVTMDNGKSYNFGLEGGTTYIDHKDKAKRDAYRKRHYANETEKKLIDNLVPSPALFSYYLLWGTYDDLNKNINYLNNLWKNKHKNNI